MNEKTLETDRFWTVPNILSLLRIVLIIPITVELRKNTPESYFISFIIIAFAYFTDYLDGFIARLSGSLSKVGRLLDPIGDKLLAITVSALLYFGKHASLYLFILILARDLTISIGAFSALNHNAKLVMPLIAGKITTVVLGILLSCYPLSLSWVAGISPWGLIFRQIVTYGNYVAVFFLIISLILYIQYYIRNFLQRKEEN